ncbi:hypothetical protein HA402_011861 [Bradysia odoriphaga]|nr:hypothetical protein HA402_011861 [Bradysia odoriphaga]
MRIVSVISFVIWAQFDFCGATFGKIEPGALCQIVAPLSPGFGSTEEQLVSAVQEFGLTPLINSYIYNVSGPDPLYPWYSNSDEFRAEDLLSAILNPDVKVIWLVNGGSGAYRTLDHLSAMLPPPPLLIAPKPIIGFSAATPIFTFLQQKYNWTGIVHGAVLDLIVWGYYENSTEITIEPLKDLLFGNADNKITLPVLRRIDNGAHFDVPLVANVTGGSIRQTVLSMGTSYKLNATNKILFLEISERTADSVNDFIDALLFSGTFDGVKAILFGDFMADRNDPPTFVEWILHRLAKERRVKAPIFRVNGLGHDTTNHPIPFNTPVAITHDSDSMYSLTVKF